MENEPDRPAAIDDSDKYLSEVSTLELVRPLAPPSQRQRHVRTQTPDPERFDPTDPDGDAGRVSISPNLDEPLPEFPKTPDDDQTSDSPREVEVEINPLDFPLPPRQYSESPAPEEKPLESPVLEKRRFEAGLPEEAKLWEPVTPEQASGPERKANDSPVSELDSPLPTKKSLESPTSDRESSDSSASEGKAHDSPVLEKKSRELPIFVDIMNFESIAAAAAPIQLTPPPAAADDGRRRSPEQHEPVAERPPPPPPPAEVVYANSDVESGRPSAARAEDEPAIYEEATPRPPSCVYPPGEPAPPPAAYAGKEASPHPLDFKPSRPQKQLLPTSLSRKSRDTPERRERGAAT